MKHRVTLLHTGSQIIAIFTSKNRHNRYYYNVSATSAGRLASVVFNRSWAKKGRLIPFLACGVGWEYQE